jgi:hypothetical protein
MIDIREVVNFVKDSERDPNRPLPSKVTIDAYVKTLTKLHKFITGENEIKNFDWTKDRDKIMNFVNINPANKKPRADATKRNMLNHILTLFKYLKNQDDIDYYQKLYVSYYEKVNDKIASGEDNSLSQSEKIISMSEYDDMLKTLKKQDMKDYLLFKLLKFYPMRNEIGTLIKISLSEFNKLKKKNKLNKNYLVVGKSKLIISRSEYKTFKSYGTIDIVVNDKKLKQELKEFTKDIEFGKPIFDMTNQMVANRLPFVSKKIVGVELSSSSIFKIVLANFKGSHKEFKNFVNKKSAQRGTDSNTIYNNYVYDVVGKQN